MIKKIKYELIFFIVLLIILALIQHSDLLSEPMDRLNLMVPAKISCSGQVGWVMFFFSRFRRLGTAEGACRCKRGVQAHRVPIFVYIYMYT